MSDASEQDLRNILYAEGIEDKEVLKNTPKRWVQMLRQQLGAESEPFEFTAFKSDVDDMVIVQDIEFSSMCAHHLLPFSGYAHVAYIPQGNVVGLSKIARCVRQQSLGLWMQEELTQSIANEFNVNLDPKGVAVVMKAEHTCMSIRGVRAPGAKTITSCMKGVFLDNKNNARAEFLSLINGR
jgi:GTP cyclohydrolase I